MVKTKNVDNLYSFKTSIINLKLGNQFQSLNHYKILTFCVATWLKGILENLYDLKGILGHLVFGTILGICYIILV